MAKDGRTAVVAIGGNSLIKDKEHITVPDQYLAAFAASAAGVAGERLDPHGNRRHLLPAR